MNERADGSGFGLRRDHCPEGHSDVPVGSPGAGLPLGQEPRSDSVQRALANANETTSELRKRETK